MIDLRQQIQAAIRHTEFSLTLHAQQQITARQIRIAEIRTALLSEDAEIIEDYPGDPRGSSCLVFGKIGNKVLHVHISYPPEIVIITAYRPDQSRWMPGFKRRK